MRNSILIALVALTACNSAPQLPPAPPLPTQDTCGATAYAGLIGAETRDLERVLILRPVRLVRPGQATGEPRPGRLAFIIDANEQITRLECS